MVCEHNSSKIYVKVQSRAKKPQSKCISLHLESLSCHWTFRLSNLKLGPTWSMSSICSIRQNQRLAWPGVIISSEVAQILSSWLIVFREMEINSSESNLYLMMQYSLNRFSSTQWRIYDRWLAFLMRSELFNKQTKIRSSKSNEIEGVNDAVRETKASDKYFTFSSKFFNCKENLHSPGTGHEYCDPLLAVCRASFLILAYCDRSQY